jgi:prepilin-type N-terminal cleavage/methylation domain-containing protein
MRFQIQRHVKAFTLLELVVVLVISALLFRLAYAALSLVQHQQQIFEHHSTTLSQISTWQQALAADFRRAHYVEATGDELRCQLPLGLVVYTWRDSVLTRRRDEIEDTLAVPVQAGTYFWRRLPRTKGLVDEASFLLVVARDTFYLQATAHYAAEQLLDTLPSSVP